MRSLQGKYDAALMMQLCSEGGDIEILKDRDSCAAVGLKSLLPEWWA